MSQDSMEQGETITLPDGRNLGYLIVGEGKPVFYFHGFPGSRARGAESVDMSVICTC